MKRYLSVVVDGSEAYVGRRRVELGKLGVFVAKFAELNHIQAVEVAGTSSTSFRDVVNVASAIDRKQTPLVRIDTRNHPTGYRAEEISERDWFWATD